MDNNFKQNKEFEKFPEYECMFINSKGKKIILIGENEINQENFELENKIELLGNYKKQKLMENEQFDFGFIILKNVCRKDEYYKKYFDYFTKINVRRIYILVNYFDNPKIFAQNKNAIEAFKNDFYYTYKSFYKNLNGVIYIGKKEETLCYNSIYDKTYEEFFSEIFGKVGKPSINKNSDNCFSKNMFSMQIILGSSVCGEFCVGVFALVFMAFTAFSYIGK
jgi:hypothetical protein